MAILPDYGSEIISAKAIPFDHKLLLDKPEADLTFAVPYGSTMFVKRHIEHHGHIQGLFWNANYKTSVWTVKREDMLNMNADVMYLDGFRAYLRDKHMAENLENAKRQHLFVRPVNDLKDFDGGVYAIKDLYQFDTSNVFGQFQPSLDTRLSVSLPKNIQSEWRFFIVDRKAVTGSQYRQDGNRVQIKATAEMLKMANGLCESWIPSDCTVMDVAKLETGEVRVIEFNCINCAGFYKADIGKIVYAMNKYMRGKSAHV